MKYIGQAIALCGSIIAIATATNLLVLPGRDIGLYIGVGAMGLGFMLSVAPEKR